MPFYVYEDAYNPRIIDGYWYVWDGYQNIWINTGVKAQGEDGEQGVGIDHTILNPDYTLTLYFTDGTTYTSPPIRGEKGEKGDKGDKGDPGESNVEPIPNDELEEILQ